MIRKILEKIKNEKLRMKNDDTNITNVTNWYHIIGIAGVTTSALAVELIRAGFKVTGSDENIYEPARSILTNAGIKYFESHSYKNLKDGDKLPDVVVVAGSKSPKNKELLFAKKQDLKIVSYPEVLKELVLHENSIVVTGTYGKTSLTSMLVYIFEKFRKNPSYMIGGYSDSIDQTIKFKNDGTQFSIIEGDEYLSSKIDRESKFFKYDPKYLVINSIEWDHVDLFSTKEEYLDNYKNLVNTLDEDDLIFANRSENVEQVVKNFQNVIYYDKTTEFEFPLLIGKFNQENANFACLVASKVLNVDIDDVVNVLQEFKGIKRRLEVKFSSENIKIIDDFGSSPAKAKGAIASLGDDKKNLIVVYEPNEGARVASSIDQYKGVFKKVDKLILPPFREIQSRITNQELKDYLVSDNIDVENVLEDNLIEKIRESLVNDKKNVILFLGSHNFEDYIQSLISNVS